MPDPSLRHALVGGNRAIDAMEREGLALYRPSQWQLPVHLCKSHEVLIRGGKRAGKSTCTVAEFASRVTAIPIIGQDGKPLPLKYPVSTPDNPLTFWIIGLNVQHIGKTIFRLLFMPGMRNSIRTVRDKKTGRWRVWNPADPQDEPRLGETKLAGAMIPPRLIDCKSWQWVERKGHVFQSVTLKNGAVIYAFPSTGDMPAMGDAVDGIWINEDIANPEYIAEWQDRLIDRDGWFLWDAWPQMQNHAIVEMIDRAAACKDDPDPDVSEFQLVSSMNPFAKEDAKARALRRMGDEDEIARRDRGELLRDAYMMYDFSQAVHLLKRVEPAQLKQPQTAYDVLQGIYSRDGRFPATWTRYLAIDPSHTRTACLSFVVPPEEWAKVKLGRRVIVEWELVMRKALASQLAFGLKEKMGDCPYQAFIMDLNKGRQTNAGEGRTTFQVYADAFRDAGVRSITTGHDFLPGLNVPAVRSTVVRRMMNKIVEGSAQILLCDQHTPATQGEFFRYTKKVLRLNGVETVLDEPQNPRKHDCMAALEYGVSYLDDLLDKGLAFVVPQQDSLAALPAWIRRVLEEQQKHAGQQPIHLGPGLAA
jgi:hypothetical protein